MMNSTVKELIEVLRVLPENMVVVTQASDHHYTTAGWSVEQAVKENRLSYSEWYPGELGDPIEVFVVR